MKVPVVAIFDIGKTNKKLLVFDSDYNIVREESVRFDEIADEDGFPCEDIGSLSAWILSKVGELKKSETFSLKAINFSTYGASLVHIDESADRVGYLYNYLKPYPDDLMREFQLTYADGKFLSETCSPIMGHLNAGMQLYWLKHKRPELFARIRSSLHFPQYLSFLLTGKKFAETTNLGCHSAMWDFQRMQYHPWLEKEGIRSRLSPITPGSHVVKINNEYTGQDIAVGIGLHDSSAAIIPYLSIFTEPFIILSTGTWAISLNPFNQNLPDPAELSKGCLSYLTYRGKPVKTSMLFAGNEHDLQVSRIAEHFNIDAGFFKTLSADTGSMLSGTVSEGPFSQRNLDDFHSPGQAYYHLMADMICQQTVYTNMVLKNSSVQNIYVDGGFCRNTIYMQYLANAFAGKKVYAATMVQGTSLGAALAIHEHWNNNKIPADILRLKRWSAVVTNGAHV